jgi:hypothetical protein
MLKQTTHKERFLFLQIFTRELIKNSKKRKIVEEKPEPLVIEQQTRPINPAETEDFLPSILTQYKSPVKAPVLKKTHPIDTRPAMAFKPAKQPKIIPKPLIRPKEISRSSPIKTGEINIQKLNRFIADKSITMIECPGPNKFILVKKAGQVNTTKTTLSQKEIDAIIKDFSEKARIPIIGGIFKASVEDLTITAVVSEFVGSKFIIYKAGPYSLIDKESQQLQQAQLQARVQAEKLF